VKAVSVTHGCLPVTWCVKPLWQQAQQHQYIAINTGIMGPKTALDNTTLGHWHTHITTHRA